MSPDWLLVPAGLTVTGLLSAARWVQTREVQAVNRTYRLTFPAELEAEAVERLLASLTGLLLPWWKRLSAQPAVVLEVRADASGIVHYLTTPHDAEGQVMSAIQAHLPGVRSEPVERSVPNAVLAAEYRTTTDRRPLRCDPAAISADLLANLQPLGADESVTVQWILTAAAPVRAPRVQAKKEGASVSLENQTVRDGEAMSSLRSKQREALLLACGRIAVQAARPRAIQLLRQLEGPWHGSRAPGVQLRRRLLPPSSVAGRVRRQAPPLFVWPALLNIEEAAGLIGWPVGVTALPGLVLGGCRLLPAANAIPTVGTTLGFSNFPGETGRPIAMDASARVRHLAVTGPTGVGKSTLLASMVIQDAIIGAGIVVIDPKGDQVDSIAERLPESRLKDVVILDPADDERPVGFNPLACTPETRELVTEQVLGVMRRIWQSNWGPRTDDILRGCLLSLSAIPKLTLCEIPALLADESFRRRVLAFVEDGTLQQFWATFNAWSAADRAQAIAPPLNKIRALTMRPRLRGILGQADGAIDFNALIRERRILLVNLASGRIGTEAAYLLGALLFAGLWDAVSAQALLSPDQRVPVMGYVDEFQHVVTLPTPAETILAEARSYGLGLTLAHQHLGQLDSDLQQAILANARSKVVFQTSQADARVFARELGGGLTPEDLQGIAGYEAVASVFAEGAVQPPATIQTTPLGPKLRDASVVKELSRLRYGVERTAVEAAMYERQRGSRRHGPAAVGRTRREAP
jgi:hypothetical protein